MTDLHERFSAWLNAPPDRDPPRDMAVHAAFCPDCQQRIAARDALAVIDLGGADRLGVSPFGAPSSTSGPLHVGPRARILAAIVLVGATGFMLVQSVDLAPASGTAGTAATSSEVPVGAVLGATGTPVPSATPSIEPLRKAASSAAARTAPPSDATTAQPVVSVPIAPATAAPATAAPTTSPATPEPTVPASLAPTASVAPSSSAPPTSTPVLSPTATPTQAATESAAPTPTESPAGSTSP